MSLNQKKYKKVPKNFAKAAILGVMLTVGMGMTAQTANAQVFEGVGEHVEEEINKTAKSVLGGIFESMRERMEHDRNERDATHKTGTTASQSAQREAIINGSGANNGNGNGNGMITTRSISVDTRSGSNGNSTHTVNSSVRADNRTQAQLEAQRQRDNYNMERQVQQELLRQELARLRAENERLLQQQKQQQQQQQQPSNNGGSAYYQPTSSSTTPTMSARDQQMLQNCRHMQNNGATVLPDSCNNLLNTTFQITTRR